MPNLITVFIYTGSWSPTRYSIDKVEILLVHAPRLSSTFEALLFGNPEVHSISIMDEVSEDDGTLQRRVVDNPLNKNKSPRFWVDDMDVIDSLQDLW